MKLINIKNLIFEYFRRDPEGNVEEVIEALDDVSLEVEIGEFIAILGRNGSGKSTLAKHLNALLLPGEGTVVVDGMDTLEGELRLQIRQTVGMVFQNPDNQIVGNTVEEDVAFGPENLGVPTENIGNYVVKALDTTGMADYRKQSPNQLSGGQKQRVAIAGVLAMEPKCIVFDEATAMLDPKGRKQMIKIAKKLQMEKNITVILITHHMDEVLAADRVFVMKEGKVVAEGKPKQIFEKKELLEECGLKLPPFYEYLYFLIGQEILSEKDCFNIENSDQLVDLIMKKKIGSIQNTELMQKEQDTLNDEIEDINRKQDIKEGIFLNHIKFIYNHGFENERIALNDISLQIGRGEFVAVIGHTGSGKSTLMQHLNGLCIPTEGNVYFNGEDVTDKDFSIKKLRQKVGLVFQYPEYQLFAETVEKDVCFGPENMELSRVEAQKRAYQAMKEVGLPDTIYDYSPLQLSGGQKRRVAIAGILAMHPDYLILDEPTAGLDPLAAENLLKMLKQLQTEKGITIVIVSHSMEEVAEYADRIVVMDQGKLCMDGPVWKVFENKEKLEKMGLEVPLGISLLYALKEAGVEVNTRKYRRMDICGELLKLQ